MIAGIRRREIAEESMDMFFRTTKLLTSRFRRNADKNAIYELCGKNNTLSNLLIGSSVIHTYHYLGIRTVDSREMGDISVEHAITAEKMEKEVLFKEISSLVQDSIKHELNLLKSSNELLGSILERIINQQENLLSSDIEEIRKIIEDKIVKIIREYPPVYLIDFTGDLSGYSDIARTEIIGKSSELKAISKEIEQELVEQGNLDNYLELSLLNSVSKKLMTDFEFDSFKDLEMETVPMRMLISKILSNLLEFFPTSKTGMNSYHESIKFLSILISKFEEAINKSLNYEEFELEILEFIEDKLKLLSKNMGNPNNLVYFLECINEKKFYEIHEFFNLIGLTNLNDFMEFVNIEVAEQRKFWQLTETYGIKKIDIVKLSNPLKNPLSDAESILRDMKTSKSHLESVTLSDIITDQNQTNNETLTEISEKANLNYDDLRNLFFKKKIIIEKLIPIIKGSNVNSLIQFMETKEILRKISKEIYYSIFSKITRQVSRILETYIKVKEDKGKYLLGLKHVDNSEDNEKWIAIKIEELMINRILMRQNELSIIFNADRNPFLVNGFILARFLDTKLSEAIVDLKSEPSEIYSNVKSLSLPEDIISPVSYCIAYDLLQRFKDFYERRKLQVIQRKEEEIETDRIKHEKLEKDQQDNTLNWIERKITTSIRRIGAKGINPTILYWDKEEDNAKCSEFMKFHSEIPGENSILERFSDFYFFALSKMSELWPKLKIPDFQEVKSEVSEIISGEMKNRIGHEPNETEIDEKIIDGDRWNISNKISIIIGKKLDKILYKKFKKSLK